MEKINVAELLKDCPKGMELDCTMYDNCTYAGIEDVGYIDILINTPSGRIRLTKEGCYIRHDDNAKCVIFPKDKTTWEGFAPPCKFKEGDIISNDMYIAIFYKADRPYTDFKRDVLYYHCWYNRKYNEFKVETDYGIGHIEGYKLASEEEKQKLFDAIKDNGYKWNTETKTLEKLVEPIFKVGDRIKNKNDKWLGTITIQSYVVGIGYFTTINDWVRIEDQDNWELVPSKFDINTLKPFESRVLVRDNKLQKWSPAMWGFYDFDSQDYQYKIIGGIARYCIPYKGNEHLLGTTDDCDEYYKTW